MHAAESSRNVRNLFQVTSFETCSGKTSALITTSPLHLMNNIAERPFALNLIRSRSTRWLIALTCAKQSEARRMEATIEDKISASRRLYSMEI